ncbi:MAG: ribonuclease H-like domain-containing protein [Clostridiales bacterium]|uniref:ribonuclease H-like domain-containing protein n=1 Tax=Clostridium sp. N3C TaxID=1776758 RepID=UPI00092E0934|nr:ribonuclease H-like domain-containing protein [Clostridium sp. N3C]NLZ48177.1 ribonuclease H-like domain-containing protein [Clostridiales bacterium]SCN22297.1 putative exonuclease [Clostridium sp. N3C]
MIVRENIIDVKNITVTDKLESEGYEDILDRAIFFDLEHYVYKKPICIGVFGACYYDSAKQVLKVTQYMIENKMDAPVIVKMAKDYFQKAYNDGKINIVTFSGNNDFTVINYLLHRYKVSFNFDNFIKVDIQDIYKETTGICTGLKTIEKQFNIVRENRPISGANLAKTFSKIMKDKDYINRMPKEKIQTILLYNEQDVVSLFEILASWNSSIKKFKEENTY